jgi:hypothetical protein
MQVVSRPVALHSGLSKQDASLARPEGSLQSGNIRNNTIKTMCNDILLPVAGLHFPVGVKECG